jgi:hypothetical protein
MEIVHHLTGLASPATLGGGVTIDLRDLSMEWEAVARDPGCPRCGAAENERGPVDEDPGRAGNDPVPAS